MNQQEFDPKMQPPPYTAPPYTAPGYTAPGYTAGGPVVHPPPGTRVYVANMNTGVIPVVIGQQFPPTSSPMRCPSCNNEIVTRVETKPTLRTHLFAALLCLIGCWPCAFIPYCTDSCQNADHYCPNCSAYIGSYVN